MAEPKGKIYVLASRDPVEPPPATVPTTAGSFKMTKERINSSVCTISDGTAILKMKNVHT